MLSNVSKGDFVKFLSFITLTALISLSSCSHWNKACCKENGKCEKNSESCSKKEEASSCHKTEPKKEETKKPADQKKS